MGSAALCLAPCAPMTAFAQEMIALDEISVNSDRAVQTDTATPVTVIDAEEIEGRQASTIAELLDSVPGVNLVNGTTPGGSAINIRGFGAMSGTYGSDQSVQIIVDGASTGAEELYRIGTQLYTDPALYKRAEVIRGSVGTFEYGSGAIGGMVLFDTKDASDFTNGQNGVAARQYLGYSSAGDGFVTSTTLAWQPDEMLELLFNYTWRTQDDYDDGNGDEVGNTASTLPSYLAKAKLHFGQDREHSVTLSYSDTQSSDKDVPYNQFSDAGWFGNVDRDIHSKTGVLAYKYDSLSNDLINVDVIVSQAQQTIDQQSATGSSSALLNADHDYKTTKVTVKNTMEFDTGAAQHRLRAGVEFINKDRQDASSAPGGDDRRKAIFLVDDVTFGGFTFSPALRFEDQHIDGTDYGYGSYDNDALMGGASLRYAFDNGLSVFGSYAYTEGLPILDDLSTAAYMSQSQKAETWELGMAFAGHDVFAAGDDLALKLNAYHTDVSDITAYSGVSDVEVQGIEIEGSYAASSGYFADLNASFANGYNRTAGASSDYWSQQPADQLRLGVGRVFQDSLRVKWEGVWNLKMDRAATPTDASFVQNVSMVYTPQGGVLDGLETTLAIENLTDQYYTPHLATRAAPGRTLKVSLAKTF
ncbi:hypothetical protein BFP70_09120 [Thioclava sp. SK-1]|nr:hypothetical protein BFP70_09120 [Thioclava sp. SK-1]